MCLKCQHKKLLLLRLNDLLKPVQNGSPVSLHLVATEPMPPCGSWKADVPPANPLHTFNLLRKQKPQRTDEQTQNSQTQSLLQTGSGVLLLLLHLRAAILT